MKQKERAIDHHVVGLMPSEDAEQIDELCAMERGVCVSPGFMRALVAELPYHRDETTGRGGPVYLTNDFDEATTALGPAAVLKVGSEPAEPSSVRGMLRLCAPLAQNGWQILCELAEDRMTFGVVAFGLAKSQGPYPGFPDRRRGDLISVLELGKGVVHIQAASGEVRVDNAPRTISHDPTALPNLIAAMTEAKLPNDAQARKRVDSVFSEALTATEGALVAVVQSPWVGGWPCEDAALLENPIDLTSLRLEGGGSLAWSPYADLVASMIRSDGIVVVDSEARLRAYRWFVRLDPDPGARLAGGARERAFRSLQSLVEQGWLAAAFIQSGDGATQFVSTDGLKEPDQAHSLGQ